MKHKRNIVNKKNVRCLALSKWADTRNHIQGKKRAKKQWDHVLKIIQQN